MATTVTILGVDRTAQILAGSLVIKFNTVDLVLVDPPTAPHSALRGATLTVTEPAWTGLVASVTATDPVDLVNGHVFVAIAANNTDTAGSYTAPFDLSDVPTNTTTFLTLEDGSGHLMLESGTYTAPGALLTEGALSYGYRGLSVTWQIDRAAITSTYGRVTIFQPGLWVGMTFALTSSNQGITAVNYVVTQVTETWITQNSTQPVYAVEFGYAPQTLRSWIIAGAP